MNFWTIVIGVYVMTTIVAITLTWREQKNRGERTPVYNFIGYLLCTIWPIVAAVTAIVYRPWQQQSQADS